VYFLTQMEQKYLLGRIYPLIRKSGVSEDLRGWNWPNPPVRPYYQTRAPMYLVCSKYCPTNRNVFLSAVKGIRGEYTYSLSLGTTMHKLAEDCFNSILNGREERFEDWWNRNYSEISDPNWVDPIRRKAEKVWNYIVIQSKSLISSRKVEQPYSTERDVMATAIPLLVGHRISGELLGLSGLLNIDAFDYLRNIVFDLKVSPEERDWYRLYPTGYAMVLEGVYGVPVDIGAVVYLNFKGDDPVIKKDIFFIGDELRSWWIEERDEKLEIISERKDPGIAENCDARCPYYNYCRG